MSDSMVRVVVNIPPQYDDPLVPTVRIFYRRMLQALEGIGISVTMRHGYGESPDADCLNICYHTCHDAPNVINAKIGYLPDYFYFDDCGYSGWSSITRELKFGPATPSSYENYRELANRYIAGHVTKYPQADDAIPDELKDYILVLTQVQNDKVLELARFSSEEMVSSMLRSGSEVGRQVVIKFHPRCTSRQFREFAGSAALRYGASVTNAHIHALLSRAAVVAVVNSGSGFEALLHLRTVMTFGASDYENAGIRITALPQISPILAGLPENGIREEWIVGFIDQYLRRRQLSILDGNFERKLVSMVRTKMATGKLGDVPE